MSRDKRPEPEQSYAARSAQLYAGAFEWADQGGIHASLAVNSAYNAQLSALTRLYASLGVSRTVGRHALIRLLYFAPQKRLTQFEVAAEMQVTSSNVTFLVDGLEREGLVQRQPHPTDRRTVYVQLTDEGDRFGDLMVPSMARFMARMLDGFSAEEKETFAALLERFQRNAETFDAKSLD
jgi:DNA-binding MarR family transcriptional regulator